ncbi:MAG TPA: penicillin-binding protein 2 [Candidatus Acidoferrales bacterium]|nr:penicillin-binding protein 2 [Candidatus Acidoferrales bacterium]
MAIERGRSRPAIRERTRQPPRRVDIPRSRIICLVVFAVLLAASIWGRLAYWQVVQSHSLSALAQAQHLTSIVLPATRGQVFDRNGQPLAIDTTAYDVAAAPDLIPAAQRASVAARLAGALGLQPSDVESTLNSRLKFAYIAKRVPEDKASAVRQLALAGISLEPVPQRTYLPGGTADVSLASSLLGFVNDAGQGQRGVEAFYQAQLAGRAGQATTYRDMLGNQISLGNQPRVNPVDGSNLYLTLDANIQYAAEQAIAAGVAKNHAQSGSVLIMDPHTGGVVAWANYPSYNANLADNFSAAQVAATQDPIVSSLYEPGSIMKVATLGGALDAGAITPTTSFDDPGYTNVAGSVIHDWDLRSHGVVTMTRVLDDSLNVGAIHAMQLEGPDNYIKYLKAFGFGAPSYVDVAGESSSWGGSGAQMPSAADWGKVQMATASFGQGIAVNMVQMLDAVNVVANGGKLAQPHVVERIGNKANPALAAPRTVISPQAAAAMTSMMKDVVQHGSGWMARVPGFQNNQTGKTGTSQMPENGKYSATDVWSSYVGFLPADNPQFTMLVVINKPNNGSDNANEGYYVSGPIWKEIAQKIILQWRIAPSS